jgi:solute:Na+ symporter, SSS family
MFSVVITEVIQYVILTISAIAIGIIAMIKVAPGTINHIIPAGWTNIFFGHGVGIDWTSKIPALNEWIVNDGYSFFSLFFMMMLFKGIFVSAAGPAPNYDMQRILSTRSPKEAAKMSSLVSVVLNPFRYFMVAGLTLLALVNFSDVFTNIPAGTKPDFETLLPQVLSKFVPIGLLGFLMAGLIAAFMSNFAATVNAAPAYIVNDIYKRYITPNATPKKYVHLSYIASIAVVIVGIAMGFVVDKINDVVLWITSALWGGYTASNVLKWYWWRFNGFGYFWGMVAGILSAILLSGILMLNGYFVTNSIEVHWFASISNFISGWPLPNNPNMNAFPYIFGLSLLGCFLATFLTKPEEPEVLKKFYSTVRPWGFWKPVYDMVIAENPAFKKNTNFLRDMFNVVIGIIWQVSLVALPIYLVMRMKMNFMACIGILLVTSFILYKTWYRKLED